MRIFLRPGSDADRSVPRRRSSGFPGFRVFGNPIVSASERPDGGNPAPVRRGRVDRLVLRTSGKTAQLVLQITKQHADCRRLERHLVLEKQWEVT
jgi:hypothetical protein